MHKIAIVQTDMTSKNINSIETLNKACSSQLLNSQREKERDSIEKQIYSINTMDMKTKKKSEEASMINDNIKEAIKENKKTLREELFNTKTLNSMIQKLKIDIEGKVKEMNINEDKNNKLKLKIQKERLHENEIGKKYNQIYNKITQQ